MLGLESLIFIALMGHKLIISVHEKQMRSGSLYRVVVQGQKKGTPSRWDTGEDLLKKAVELNFLHY